jgi:hypothetical protein
MSTLKEQFTKDGFVIVDVLTEEEILKFRNILATLMNPDASSGDKEERSSAFQHLGDDLKDFGKENRQYYFHILTKPGTEPLHEIYHHAGVMQMAEALIGPQLIINNASVLAANKGVKYDLGWHRDVIQIPEEEIKDELFSKERFHNSVQINLPLYDEDALWVVPGSHHRSNLPEEEKVFEGSKHYSPKGLPMPGSIAVPLKAGQAVFYNNNLIHRGYTQEVMVPRRTVHMGYHSALYPPTWHFYLLNDELLTGEYLDRLSPTMRRMMDDYLACRKQFPSMNETWKSGFWDQKIDMPWK